MSVRTAAYFQAVAIDFDGTLAEGTVAPDTLEALAEARARGVRTVLVTGRIMDELRIVFPDAEKWFDAIVAENGAVVISPACVRELAPPVGRMVSAELTARGVAHRNGQVLIACAARDSPAALEAVRQCGLDCQFLRNRQELMILPAGLTKGTGLLYALDQLGISAHSTIGVGDAENDHSLLDACEIGVAVSNAVDAIRAHADIVLALPDGQGVADLLRGPILTGRTYIHPRRWQLSLGNDDRGRPVTLPASQLNVAICGGTGAGKSYLAGLLLEQFIGLNYSVVVFDPEGDYLELGELHGVFVTSGHEDQLAGPASVVRLLRHGCTAVIIDVSGLTAQGQADYARTLADEIEACRTSTGLPHWLAVDEAQGPVGRDGTARHLYDPGVKGHLLVTWRPEDLSADTLAALDAVIAIGSAEPADTFVDLTAAVADMPRAEIARLLAGAPGRAVLAWRQRPHQAVAFTPGPRATSHRRHEHKYGYFGVPPERQFYFRGEASVLTGMRAASLADLEFGLTRCDEGVIRHHCAGHDFSHWVAGVFRDRTLAKDLDLAESLFVPGSPGAVVEQARMALIAALQNRHLS